MEVFGNGVEPPFFLLLLHTPKGLSTHFTQMNLL